MRNRDEKSHARMIDRSENDQGIVYQLDCDGIEVALSFASSDEQRQWQAEGIAKVIASPLVARGVGPSRSQAFRVLRDAWCSQRESCAFPRLDWEAIREVLQSAGAI
jgi:hypothetical protein